MDILSIIILALKIFASVFAGLFLAVLFNRDLKKAAKEKYRDIKDSHYQRIKKNPNKQFEEEGIEEKMLATGIKYRMGSDFGPFDYMCFRLALGFAVGIASMFIQVYFFVPVFLLVFFMIPFYFKQEDQNDNEAMLEDITNLLSMVALQLKSGVFISKVIYECFRMTENPRLRQALMELSIDMENFSSIKDAAIRFRKKFNNPQLDNFAKTLEQAQETGQSLEFFEDIQKSIASINETIASKEEQKKRHTADTFMLILFLGPVVFVFYIFFGMLTGSGFF